MSELNQQPRVAEAPGVGAQAQVQRCVHEQEWAEWGASQAGAWQAWLTALVGSALSALWPTRGVMQRVSALQVMGSVPEGAWVSATVRVRGVHPSGQRVCECHCVDAQGQRVAQAEGLLWGPAGSAPAPTPAPDRLAPMLHAARACVRLRAAVAHPCSESALQAVFEAAEAGLIEPILVGPQPRLMALAERMGLSLTQFETIDVPHSHAAAEAAVGLVRVGRAGLLIKGSLHTDELLEAVLSTSQGLRTERRLSHVFVMDVPSYHKLLFISDAAINIAPTLEDKRDICQNAIELAQALGVAQPKVAVLSAVETVTPKIGSTLDAAALCKMADRGQIIGGLLDGPLALDNAISAEAAAIKGIQSPVAGAPDILLAPDLDAGNILAKQLTFMAGAESAGLVLGARVPIVLTSRADSVRARLSSCALAVLLAARYAAVAPAKTVR